jgi:hypothetical protein
MVPIVGGTQITQIAPREAAPVPPIGAATPQSDPTAVSPPPPFASTQSACVFSLLVDQHTNRVVIEWSDRASGLVIAEMPGKTTAKAIEESNVPASSSEHVNLQI